MSHKSKFYIVLAAAAITFGSLYASLGKPQLNRACAPCHAHHCCMTHESELKNAEPCPTIQTEHDTVK